jgi:hypothetical protein
VSLVVFFCEENLWGVPSFAFLSFLVGSRLSNLFFLRQRLVQWARVVEWNIVIGLGSVELHLAHDRNPTLIELWSKLG